MLRDEYPPFSWEPGDYPLDLIIERAERQSRLRLFWRWFAYIPNYIVFWFVSVAGAFVTFMAWWAILFTGRYPRGLFRFNVGVSRWWFRQTAYIYLLRDEFPPYSISADARPGNEVVSAIIGVPLGTAYLAFSIAPLFDRGDEVIVSANVLNSPAALAAAAPAGEANQLRITLLGYEDDAVPPPDADISPPLYPARLVSFNVRAEQGSFLPVFYTPVLFSLDACGESRFPAEIDIDATFEESGFFNVFAFGGDEESTIYFWIGENDRPCDLSYFTGQSEVSFRFE